MNDMSALWSILIIAGVIAFLGYNLENIWLIFTKGYADNRNMNLPFLLGYAVIVLGMYFLYGTPQCIGNDYYSHTQRYLLYFAAAFFTVSIGEIILGTFVEHFFGFEYWNYTRLPMHITKYTSVPTSLGFALIITEFMDKAFPRLMDFTASIEPTSAAAIGTAFAILLPLDFIISFRKMFRERRLNTLWRIHILPKGVTEMIHDYRLRRKSIRKNSYM